MKENIYFKQKNLFNPEDNQPKIHIYGVGSIGTHVAVGLAKLGFINITCYDYDEVESSNIPAQFFCMEDVGREKGYAIQEMCKVLSGVDIEYVETVIDENFSPDTSFGSVHICCFDNISGRKILFDKIKEYPVFFIDGRIGGFNLEVYSFETPSKVVNIYEKSLDGVFSELLCGEKCLWAVNSQISSIIISNLLRYIKGFPVPFMLKKSYLSEKTIARYENE